MKKLFNRLFFCSFFLLSAHFSLAQKTTKQQAKAAIILQAIDSQSFIFHAQQALPLGGGNNRPLTSDYFLRATPDSIKTYLPYFGRAYAIPYNQTDGGINVNTNKFEYKKTPHKKGGWDIVIKPTEQGDVQQLILFVSTNGYGTLQVISTNRQVISFYGYVSRN